MNRPALWRSSRDAKAVLSEMKLFVPRSSTEICHFVEKQFDGLLGLKFESGWKVMGILETFSAQCCICFLILWSCSIFEVGGGLSSAAAFGVSDSLYVCVASSLLVLLARFGIFRNYILLATSPSSILL